MSIHVDARGLNCPQPVIATKRALDSIASGIVTTVVDNVVAKENVAKFAAATSASRNPGNTKRPAAVARSRPINAIRVRLTEEA